MSIDTYDLIVIGGGPVGLSTAYHAGKRGLRTLVLESAGFFNDQGSSAGASRQFRLQYSEKYMAELAIAAQTYWADLQLYTFETLVQRTGSLWFGDPALSSQEGGIQAAMDTMDALSVPYTALTDGRAIESAAPFRDLPSNYSGFFQADGGIIRLKATERALYDAALATGRVTFRAWEPVLAIEPVAKGVTVVSCQARHRAEKVAITAGPYTNQLLSLLGCKAPYSIWQMSSAYFRKTDFGLRLPTWFVFQKPQNTSLFYGFPEVDWAFPGYIRVAPDIPDRILTDPSERSRAPSEKSLALTAAWVRDHMVGLDPTPHFTSTCMIALAADASRELLLDYAPGSDDRIVVYTAGWAAKFIPILGEMINQMLDGPLTAFEFGDARIARSHFTIDWQEN